MLGGGWRRRAGILRRSHKPRARGHDGNTSHARRRRSAPWIDGLRSLPGDDIACPPRLEQRFPSRTAMASSAFSHLRARRRPLVALLVAHRRPLMRPRGNHAESLQRMRSWRLALHSMRLRPRRSFRSRSGPPVSGCLAGEHRLSTDRLRSIDDGAGRQCSRRFTLVVARCVRSLSEVLRRHRRHGAFSKHKIGHPRAEAFALARHVVSE